jgi:hypothetical protein
MRADASAVRTDRAFCDGEPEASTVRIRWGHLVKGKKDFGKHRLRDSSAVIPNVKKSRGTVPPQRDLDRCPDAGMPQGVPNRVFDGAAKNLHRAIHDTPTRALNRNPARGGLSLEVRIVGNFLYQLAEINRHALRPLDSAIDARQHQ